MARISRIVVAIEAGVILAPITLLALYGLFAIVLIGGFASEFFLLAVPTLIALAALGCGWHLTLAFVRFGREALVALPTLLWVPPIAVAAVSLLALWAKLTMRLPETRFLTEIELFTIGCPAVLPLVHLAIERWARADDVPEPEPPYS